MDPEDYPKVGKKLRGEQAPPFWDKKPVRILYVDNYCQFCKMMKKAVVNINMKLAYWAEPIQIVHVSNEKYRTEMEYKQTRVTPELFIDGIVVEGMTSEAYAEAFLRELLQDEIIVEA